MKDDADDRFETLTLRDGRQLAWQCHGQPGGRPLYFFHGFPGCRLQAALLHAQALAAGVCLVAPDRPGFGRSTYQAGRSILGWANDVAQLADHLQHSRFGVLGISCGGPYALACAHQLPGRVDYAGLLAGMGPMDLPEIRSTQMPVLKALFALARTHVLLAAPLLLPDYLLFRGNPQRAVRALSGMMTPPDRQALAANPGLAEAFGDSLREAYHQGMRAAMREAQLIARPRGFALQDIGMPVHVYQGAHDRNVPPEMGQHLASTLPRGRWHFYPDEGHLSIVTNRGADCLRDFLAVSRP